MNLRLLVRLPSANAENTSLHKEAHRVWIFQKITTLIITPPCYPIYVIICVIYQAAIYNKYMCIYSRVSLYRGSAVARECIAGFYYFNLFSYRGFFAQSRLFAVYKNFQKFHYFCDNIFLA